MDPTSAVPVTKILLKSVRKQLAAVYRPTGTFEFRPAGKTPLVGINPNPDAPANERFVTVCPIVFRHSVIEITIPRGFACDLASVPRIATWIPGFAPTDASWRAAIVHDYLYRNLVLSRHVADGLFLEILAHDKVAPWKIYVMGLAFRWFGAGVYRKYVDRAVALAKLKDAEE